MLAIIRNFFNKPEPVTTTPQPQQPSPGMRGTTGVRPRLKEVEDFSTYTDFLSLNTLKECFADQLMFANVLRQRLWWALVGDPNSYVRTGDSSSFWAIVHYLNSISEPVAFRSVTNAFGGTSKTPVDATEYATDVLTKVRDRNLSIPTSASTFTATAKRRGITTETALAEAQAVVQAKRDASEATFRAALSALIASAGYPCEGLLPRAGILTEMDKQAEWVASDKSRWGNDPIARETQLRFWEDSIERVKCAAADETSDSQETAADEADESLFDRSTNE